MNVELEKLQEIPFPNAQFEVAAEGDLQVGIKHIQLFSKDSLLPTYF